MPAHALPRRPTAMTPPRAAANHAILMPVAASSGTDGEPGLRLARGRAGARRVTMPS